MSKFLTLFQGKKFLSPPVWFMRQAGRSLPEYRAVRNQCTSFLELCYTPHLAAKVTQQPIERFSLDAAILFSDILVIPDALGQKVQFKEGEGPSLSEISLTSFDKTLSFQDFFERLSPVYEAAALAKKTSVPLIGFAGAPWTLALYMIQGGGSKDFAEAKIKAFQNKALFSTFLRFLEDAIFEHLSAQVKAGVDALQLFDTWAGFCPAAYVEEWILSPTKRLVQRLQKKFPRVPLIGFPRGLGLNLLAYGRTTGVSALSLDSAVPLSEVVEVFPQDLILQGNLDPAILAAGGDLLQQEILSIHQAMKGRPYIFNLGHGVLPSTPLAHLEACVKGVRALEFFEARERQSA